MKFIKKDDEYKEVLQKGTRVRWSAGLILFLPADEAEVGIITSKKLGKANVRNRIRRRVREAAKQAVPGGHLHKKFVIIPGKNAAIMPFNELVLNLKRAIGAE